MAADLALIEDAGLLAENAGLTEWPVPLLGRFDEAFLDVPPEVIQLTARVNALFRRLDALRSPTARDSVFTLRGLTLELERMRISWNGTEVPLTVTEFWMAHALVRHPGHVKSREQLMREAQVVVDDATVTSHIKRMRRKFEQIDPAFDEIDTVHGAGYRWRP